jgi:SufS family cysteine desulfurase
MFDVAAFRAEFAFFQHHSDWVYLDNAASTQKPGAVLQSMQQFYQQDYSNVHRGAHGLSQRATALFEKARADIAAFFNAASPCEIIWTAGATAALNQLAFGLTGTILQQGDCILLTALEHHANIVPWQFHSAAFGVDIAVVPLTTNNHLDSTAFAALLAEKKPKVVSFTHVSNGLGHVSPLTQMLTLAKQHGAITIVDGSQGVSYEKVDVQALDCDFYLCSAHKLYGPTGIGVLYGKTAMLEQLRPLHYGGEMIKQVSFSKTSFNQLPYRLEAGTPNIAGAIGFAAAINWYQQFDMHAIQAYKQQLLQKLWQGVHAISGIELLSTVENNAGIVSLNLQNEHPADVAVLLDQQKIAVRAGTHCAMPLFQALQQPGAVRLSLAPYNTEAEIAQTLQALATAADLLA